MSRILIGVDVGGSKTAAAVLRDDAVIARSEGPGAAVRPGRALSSAATISEVTRRALGTIGLVEGDVLLVGAAGAGRDPERSELRSALAGERLAQRVIVTTDIEIALAAAFGEESGIVVSAGTGSIAVGRDRKGKLHRIGGYGWQMGDEGSGYAIGRAALGAVGRAADDRSPATALSSRIPAATGTADLDALIRWAAGAGPAEVASLAPHVLAVAADGDAVAQGIADYAARELCQLATHVLPRLEVEAAVPVALTGGLLANPHLRRAVLARLAEEPAFAPVDRPIDAALGAAQLAARSS